MKIHTFAAMSASILFIGLSLTGCYYDTEEELYPDSGTPTTCDTTTVRYSVEVKSILDSKCNTCHGGASASAGIRLDTYADTKAYLDAQKVRFVSSVVQDGVASVMPKGGAKLIDCDINKLKAWINAGYPEN
jgi:hypothetical protein